MSCYCDTSDLPQIFHAEEPVARGYGTGDGTLIKPASHAPIYGRGCPINAQTLENYSRLMRRKSTTWTGPRRLNIHI